MARVLLDLRMVTGRVHGIARYALELARRVPALAPDLSFHALVSPDGLPSNLGPLHPDLPQVRARAGFLSALEQPGLALSLATSDPDLFHATSFSVPALWPGALVATLHDANHLALAENYGHAQAAYYRLVVGPRARRAQALITVSEFSRGELTRHLGLDPYRIQVIPNGVDARFHPVSGAEAERFRARMRLPDDYVLVVGNDKPHKNLARIAAFAEALPIAVVLLCGGGIARRLGFPAGTVDLEEVIEEDLPLLYSGASALLFPSYYEGFGLPALEAMASGCPVVAARAGSLPEVCGQAALLVAPGATTEWKDAVLRVLREAPLRAELRQLGLERAARFGWDACAQQTLAVYRRVLARRGERT